MSRHIGKCAKAGRHSDKVIVTFKVNVGAEGKLEFQPELCLESSYRTTTEFVPADYLTQFDSLSLQYSRAFKGTPSQTPRQKGQQLLLDNLAQLLHANR